MFSAYCLDIASQIDYKMADGFAAHAYCLMQADKNIQASLVRYIFSLSCTNRTSSYTERCLNSVKNNLGTTIICMWRWQMKKCHMRATS